MANPTTNYGFVLPTPTDLVTDLPADFEVALQGVDTQMKTNADAAIAKSIVDAKGDLIAGTGSDAVSRLAVGTNDQVLTADSTTATGLKWSSPAGGAEPFLTPEISTYFIGRIQNGNSITQPIDLNRTYYLPVYLPAATYDRIAMRHGEYTSNGTMRMGLYNVSATTGLPSTVVFDAGTVAISAANTTYSITINQTLNAGYYYMALNCQAFSGDGNYVACGAMPNESFFNQKLQSSFTGGVGITFFYQNSVSGAFATATSLVGDNSSAVPIIGMRFA